MNAVLVMEVVRKLVLILLAVIIVAVDQATNSLVTIQHVKVVYCVLIFSSFPLDINECMEGTHNCSSSSNNFCVNTIGSYRCQCNTGYQDINGVCTGLVISGYCSFSFISRYQ